jgi:transcriptional regulator with XRE-family HTH domain
MAEQNTELLMEGRAAARTGRGKAIREAAGLNRSEVARLVGVTPSMISRWESGGRFPGGETAIAYAKVLRRLEELTEKVAAP